MEYGVTDEESLFFREIIQQQAEGSGMCSIWAELSKTTTSTVTSINPETQALVTTDFPEEDEDEEYTPETDEHVRNRMLSHPYIPYYLFSLLITSFFMIFVPIRVTF